MSTVKCESQKVRKKKNTLKNEIGREKKIILQLGKVER